MVDALGMATPDLTRRYILNYNPNGAVPNSPRSGYVYLILCVGTTRYKIGRTADIQQRLIRLQEQSPFPLKLAGLFYADDCFAQEKRLHELAKQYRVRGEWFELPKLWLRQQREWFYNTECTVFPKFKSCPINNFVAPANLPKVEDLISSVKTPLPLQVPETKSDLQSAISLLGNQTQDELTLKSQQKLIRLVGTYPSKNQAALWKKGLRSILKAYLVKEVEGVM